MDLLCVVTLKFGFAFDEGTWKWHLVFLYVTWSRNP